MKVLEKSAVELANDLHVLIVKAFLQSGDLVRVDPEHVILPVLRKQGQVKADVAVGDELVVFYPPQVFLIQDFLVDSQVEVLILKHLLDDLSLVD